MASRTLKKDDGVNLISTEIIRGHLQSAPIHPITLGSCKLLVCFQFNNFNYKWYSKVCNGTTKKTVTFSCNSTDPIEMLRAFAENIGSNVYVEEDNTYIIKNPHKYTHILPSNFIAYSQLPDDLDQPVLVVRPVEITECLKITVRVYNEENAVIKEYILGYVNIKFNQSYWCEFTKICYFAQKVTSFAIIITPVIYGDYYLSDYSSIIQEVYQL